MGENGTALIAVVIVVFLLTMVAVFALVSYLDRKRREQLQIAANRIQFSFSVEADPSLLEKLCSFHLFSQGHSRKIRNVMCGSVGDVSVRLFDYKYTTGSGKHSRVHHQTVCLFESERLQLPQFMLRPEHMFHRIAGAFGYQDIDFEDDRTFSDAYLLQGGDEGQIRPLFGEQVTAFYTRHSGLCTEGQGQRLIHYQSNRRIDPEKVQDFLQEGLDVLALYVERGDSGEELFLLGLELAAA